MKNYLNFETDIKNLENELEKLKDPYNQGGLSEVDTDKISKTQNEMIIVMTKLKYLLICLFVFTAQLNAQIQSQLNNNSMIIQS